MRHAHAPVRSFRVAWEQLLSLLLFTGRETEEAPEVGALPGVTPAAGGGARSPSHGPDLGGVSAFPAAPRLSQGS